MRKFFTKMWRAFVDFMGDKESQFDQGRLWAFSELINFRQKVNEIRRQLEFAQIEGRYYDFELGAADAISRLEQVFDPDRRTWIPVSMGVTLRQHVLGRRAIAPDVLAVVYPILVSNELVWVLAHNDEVSPLRIDEYIPIGEFL